MMIIIIIWTTKNDSKNTDNTNNDNNIYDNDSNYAKIIITILATIINELETRRAAGITRSCCLPAELIELLSPHLVPDSFAFICCYSGYQPFWRVTVFLSVPDCLYWMTFEQGEKRRYSLFSGDEMISMCVFCILFLWFVEYWCVAEFYNFIVDEIWWLFIVTWWGNTNLCALCMNSLFCCLLSNSMFYFSIPFIIMVLVDNQKRKLIFL